ncbi:MAG: hypothetical protein COA32_04665 [Fluviicola sp.]|nr:MAG: hypothetical protein COA32_04665 [Fluviicola sp.]
MKKYILYLMLCLSFTTRADQLEAVLEIEYNHKGERQIGYLLDQFWLFQVDINPDFENIFKKTYAKHGIDSIEMYKELVDQSALFKKASFPIYKFILKDGSQQLISIDNMKDIVFRKSWKRSGYTKILFTDIELKDTTWIGGNFDKINLGHDDVGCRINVYSSMEDAEQIPLIKQIYEIVPDNGDYPSKEQLDKVRAIAAELKRYNVVVAMACGC